jgi:hypothetical protein
MIANRREIPGWLFATTARIVLTKEVFGFALTLSFGKIENLSFNG